MSTAYFDSHKYAKRLVETGIPPDAADVMAEAMFELACEVSKLSALLEQRRFRNELEVSHQFQAGSATVEHREIDRLVNAATIDSKIDVMASKLRGEIARSATETTRWAGIWFIAIIFLLEVILIASIP